MGASPIAKGQHILLLLGEQARTQPIVRHDPREARWHEKNGQNRYGPVWVHGEHALCNKTHVLQSAYMGE